MEIVAFASFAILVFAWLVAPNTAVAVPAATLDRAAEPAAA